MAFEIHFTIEGTKQGKFKGDHATAEQPDKSVGLSLAYGVQSARDAATGQASGKRQHKPVVLVKEMGAASPQIFTAVMTNEVLSTVLFEFYHSTPAGKQAPGGKQEPYLTLRLTNALITDVRYYTEEPSTGPAQEREEISFTFQQIEMEHVPSQGSASGTWIPRD